MVVEVLGKRVTAVRAAEVEVTAGLDEPLAHPAGRAHGLVLDDEYRERGHDREATS
jgi:hypothetical protein